jgi:glycine cleavage system aminomethyltransferase T
MAHLEELKDIYDMENNPFEVTGLERLVEAQEADYAGKAALERIRGQGVTRKLVGIEAPGDPTFFELTEARPALADGQRIGRVTDLVWSPRLQRNIGCVWVPAELADPGNDLEIEWNNGQRTRQDRSNPLPRPTQAHANHLASLLQARTW